MKCYNCGAPIQMTQKFCPNCGSPNVEFKKHIDDMEQYDKKFNRTRSKVIGSNTMLGYDMAQRKQQKYYDSHSEEIQTRLRKLLEDGEYTTVYSMYSNGDCSLKDNGDRYAWNDFYNVASNYTYLRKGIINMMEEENNSYYSSEYMNTIARAVSEMEDDVDRCFNSSYHNVSEESAKYIKDMHDKSHELLKAYFNLTDEDISGLADMSQTDILTLITRRGVE